MIVVTGMPGSGKEEFLNVAMSIGIPFVRMGDIVRNEHANARSTMSIGEFADAERKRHGYNIWAKRSMEKMHGTIFLVDGCRSMAEIEAFRSLSDNVLILGIHSPPKVRFSRLVERARSDAPADINEFNERDAREIRWGISEVIALADEMVVNDSSLDKFRKEAEILLKGIR